MIVLREHPARGGILNWGACASVMIGENKRTEPSQKSRAHQDSGNNLPEFGPHSHFTVDAYHVWIIVGPKSLAAPYGPPSLRATIEPGDRATENQNAAFASAPLSLGLLQLHAADEVGEAFDMVVVAPVL